MKKKVRFALVGCGDACLRYGESFKSVEHGELIVAMDIKKEVARSFGETYGVPYTDRMSDVLGNKDVDAVIVVVPHYLHAPVTMECARAGKHVLCEKPMATTMEDAERMVDACGEAGVKLGISFASRYREDYRMAKELLGKNLLGRIFQVNLSSFGIKNANYWTQGYRNRVVTHWRGNLAEAGGGFLIMNMVHFLDIIRFVTDLEVVRVSAEYATFNTPVQVEDTLSAIWEFNNGAIGYLAGSTCAYGGGSDGVTIFGTEGQLALKGSQVNVFVAKETEGLKANEWNAVPCDVASGPYDAYRPLVEGFAEALLGNTDPPVGAREGVESLRIITGMYESGRKRMAVTLGG